MNIEIELVYINNETAMHMLFINILRRKSFVIYEYLVSCPPGTYEDEIICRCFLILYSFAQKQINSTFLYIFFCQPKIQFIELERVRGIFPKIVDWLSEQ